MKRSERLEAILELQAEGTALRRGNHSHHRWGEGVRQISAHGRNAFFPGILVKGAKGLDLCF